MMFYCTYTNFSLLLKVITWCNRYTQYELPCKAIVNLFDNIWIADGQAFHLQNTHKSIEILFSKTLNTLFNIVEAPFKKKLNFDVCVVWWCSDGPLNSQWIQKFWHLCGLYQDIYDWISPLNKQSGRPFILTQQSMGRNEYGISGHLHIFAFLKHLIVLLRCNFFQGFIFTPYQKTDSM